MLYLSLHRLVNPWARPESDWSNSMPLLNVLSLDGMHHILSKVVEDRILKLRLVSRDFKEALETNASLKINIHISDTGLESLMADFLQRWQGSLYLHYRLRGWTPNSKWFKEFRDALALGRLRPPSLLSLSVDEGNLIALVETLMMIPTRIQQLRIWYRGNGAELIAASASLASLGSTLTMEISVLEKDCGGRQTSAWLQQLEASRINLCGISFR